MMSFAAAAIFFWCFVSNADDEAAFGATKDTIAFFDHFVLRIL